MKKYALVLLTGSILGLAACGSETNTTTQEQIDSTANARSATMEAELKAKNDSLIAEMARMRADSQMHADSLAAAHAGRPAAPATRTTVTTKPRTTTTTTTTTTKSNGTKVTDRPGATDAHVNGKPEKPKSVSDRPGAENH